jgi:outer membrane protein assembly factor BamB
LAAILSSIVTMFFVLHTRSVTRGSLSVSTTTPATPAAAETPAIPVVPQGSLYVGRANSLARFDLQTGKTIWDNNAGYPVPILVMGKKLFFENAETPGAFLEAVDADTGKQIWRNVKYGSGPLLGSGDILYDGGCDLSATSDPCHLYAINANTGAQLWSYDLPQGNAWLVLQKGVLYGVSYTDYFALNATSGTQLWHRNLSRYIDQEANMTPVVSGNVLSYASCNVTKQSRGAPGCDLFAFNTSTGAELWHMYSSVALMAPPTILDGVVYVGAIDGTVYAVDEQSGKKLWTINVGGPVAQMLSGAGAVYVGITGSDSRREQIEALDAKTHKPLWGQVQTGNSTIISKPGPVVPFSFTAPVAQRMPFTPLSGNGPENPFILDRGLIYISNDPGTISALNASDGSTLKQYNVGDMYTFAVVAR